MRRCAVITLIVLSTLSCKSSSGDYAGAAITAGMAVVAAAAYREASGGCIADCAPGEQCDADSGYCVAAPCRATCHADYRCMWLNGREQCVPPNAQDHLEPVADAPRPSQETKQWLCFLAGIPDCPEPARRQGNEPDVDIVTGLN